MAGVSSYTTEPGESFSILYSAPDGSTVLYPQAKIYNSSDVLDSTVNLSHIADGVYTGIATAPSNKGNYYVITKIYLDSGHTNLSTNDEVLVEPLNVVYGYRPSFSGGNTSVFDAKQLESIINPIDEINKRLDKIEIELAKKSEFDVEKQKVITDIEIKPTSFREIKESISLLKGDIANNIKELRNNLTEKIKNLEIGNKSGECLSGINDVSSKIDNVSDKIINNISDNFKFLSSFIEDAESKKIDFVEIGENNYLELDKKLDDILKNNSKHDGSQLRIMTDDAINRMILSKPNNDTKILIDKFNDGYENLLSVIKDSQRDIVKSKQFPKLKRVLGGIKNINSQLNTNEQIIEMLNIQDHKRITELSNIIIELFKQIINSIEKIESNQITSYDFDIIQESINKFRNEL